ncbi:hypothetical protein [Anaerostipes sp.]|uniref:hypothetical protein n=1 Tax=Anaerostipes sp. TaxID=1872530 RepID=UPI0025BB879C|nr:hypothetical protein [Anaerostipes sp.]MBS7007095.1 hypothetical protein [Anaerostipes sp.]
MGEVIKMNTSEDLEVLSGENEIIRVAEDMLDDVKKQIEVGNTISIPIAELATLGAGVSSLIPSLHTVTQTTTVNVNGLFQLANAEIGDTLQKAKNGNFWGALKTSTGKSKFVQLQEAGPLSASTATVLPIDPATMMMAAALFLIEKKLDGIAEMQKQILDFLEKEKKSEIEADIETLIYIVNKYKSNWDNETYVKNNHKLVLDIQRTARKNMLLYQKEVSGLLNSKQLITVQLQVKSKLDKLQDKFKFYRLSLYIYSLASLLEIMLSGNFKEENISGVKDEVVSLANTYREMFRKASESIEKESDSSLETNLLKGLGVATKGAGKLIGAIPVVKEGQVDEFLQGSGAKIKKNASELEMKYVKEFASIANPEISGIIQQMNEMVRIYNHTSQIYFDENRIYIASAE